MGNKHPKKQVMGSKHPKKLISYTTQTEKEKSQPNKSLELEIAKNQDLAKEQIKNVDPDNMQMLENIKIFSIDQHQEQNVLFIVDGYDQRKICQTPNEFPFSAIGILYLEFRPNIFACATAFLIGSNLALTAAHNIYTRQHESNLQKVRLILADSNGQRKSYNVVCVYFPKEYKNEPTDKAAKQFDFALMILQYSEQLQKKQVLTISQQIKANDQIQIYGYPEDLNKKNQDARLIDCKLFGCKHFISEVTERMIIHTVDTSRGQSGSPILKLNKQKRIYQVVGMHTKGNQLIRKNQGIRFNLTLVNKIKAWIKGFHIKQYNQEQVLFIKQQDLQIIKEKTVRITSKTTTCITPDTTTYAWKENKYRQDNANKNICICQGISDEWLCSAQDLACNGEFMFTIKALKVSKNKQKAKEGSHIWIGVMDSKMKEKKRWTTLEHCVYLKLLCQGRRRPNQEQTKQEWIDCSCQSTLLYLPCLIECHVNRQLNTIK